MKKSHPILPLAAILVALTASAHAQTSVTVVNGRLSLLMDANPQDLKVEVGPTSGQARVFGFAGIPSGTTYDGITAIDVVTGLSTDKVEFQIQTTDSLDVRIDTRGGDAETKVSWKLLPGAADPVANLDLVSTLGGKKVAVIEVESDAARAKVDIDTGNSSEVAAKVLSDDPSDFLDVSFNGRGLKTGVEVISAASQLEVDWVGRHTLSSEVKFAVVQIRPAVVSVLSSVVLGEGDDKVEAKISAPGSQVTLGGFVRSAGGNDLVQIESEAFSTVPGMILNGANGNDLLSLIIKGRFQLSQTLQARLLGGEGDDVLVLTTDTAIVGTGLPNDRIPVVDGGIGFDRYNAFGLILNCEARL